MLAGSQILQPPPASHEELCARLESTLLDISDLAMPARLLKDAEALLGDWFAAERSKVERSHAPSLYRAIETLTRLTSIRRTLIGLAKALMEPPRPPAPTPPKPAQATPVSSAPTLPSPSGATASTPDDPAATQSTSSTQSTQAAQPANLIKLSFPGIHPPAPDHDSTAPAPPLGSAPSPTPQPKRGPLVRSSAEIVSQVRSCPRLATLNTKRLELNINSIVRLKAALAYARPVPRPGRPTPAPSREHLTAQGFSFHPLPPSTADPPDSS